MPKGILLDLLRQRIRRARVEKQLTQEEAAERAGLALRSYQRFEGRSGTDFNPTFIKVVSVAHALEVSLDDLAGAPTQEELEALGEPREVPRVRRTDS